jgi:hypothetical protein
MEDHMILIKHVGLFIFALGILSLPETIAHAQQWNGAANSSGTIWRPGNIVVGGEPQRGDNPRAMIEVTRPLAMSKDLDDRLFSANMIFRDSTSPKFEVDTRHAYAGGARSKASILDPTLDFAVHRSAVIGLVNINEMPRPNDYMLVVGGKILAEEVRIKLIKDWADYVFAKDYPLKSLAEVETFIHANHHLPEIPNATEVEKAGVGLGDMQSKLLLKIEELTLYLIQQNKTIETLQAKLTRMEQKTKFQKTTGRH